MIEFLLKATELKEEKRTGWQLRNIEDPETVADHSWGTAFLSLIYAEEAGVDKDRAVKMALVHDLGEAEIGDIPSRAAEVERKMTDEEKAEKEHSVMKEFADRLEEEILELYREYSERKTSEAQFVKDMDMIELCLQALKYEKNNRYDKDENNPNFQEYDNLDEFFVNTENKLQTETGKQLHEELKKRYQKAKKE